MCQSGEVEHILSKYCINFLIRSKGAYPEFGNNQDIFDSMNIQHKSIVDQLIWCMMMHDDGIKDR